MQEESDEALSNADQASQEIEANGTEHNDAEEPMDEERLATLMEEDPGVDSDEIPEHMVPRKRQPQSI